MTDDDLEIRHMDPALYNADIAPVSHSERRWGWFEIFNVWANDIQSLFGYTLAASLFLKYGLNGWATLAAIIVAGVVLMFLVNLSGKPSVRYGIPFAVMIRASTGVHGANFPAMLRAITGIFWFGVQTYFASTALSLLLNALFGKSAPVLLGLSGIDWVAFIIVWTFQLIMLWRGIEAIRQFLVWAGPAVYVVMITLAFILWYYAGNQLFAEAGNIFSGTSEQQYGSVAAFFSVMGTMIAYFAAVAVNYGDFSRFVRSEREMALGNLLGLPVNIAVFSLIALFVTAGTLVIFGEQITNPTDIIERVGSLPLTIVAAIVFFIATVGITHKSEI